jgi:hypothetical protein
MQRYHSAITYYTHGKGFGIYRYPQVKMGLVGKAGSTWHILDPNSPICGTRGHVRATQEEVQPTCIVFAGLPVCAKCRDALGPIPMPELVPRKKKEAV